MDERKIRVYVWVIQNSKLNPITGQTWTINDVPEAYRVSVQSALS